MGSFFNTIVELGDKLSDLVVDQAEWSQKTFGSDSERGPAGALKHLAKEAKEALDAWNEVGVHSGKFVEFREEMADCLLLILDASRRGGIKPMQLIEAAQEKMQKNKARKWPTPTSDEPVEHLK